MKRMITVEESASVDEAILKMKSGIHIREAQYGICN